MIAYRPGYYGYLGNELFQAAATKALSLARRTGYAFPRNKPDLHKIFNLTAADEFPILDMDRTAVKLHEEPHFHFDESFWDLPDWTVLSGYFQSEKYFAPYAAEIRREFTFRDPIPWPAFKGWVSIHVRRGDYLTFPHHHPPCQMDYYKAAMAEFPGAHFIVFSDDIAWCKLYLRGPEIEYSEGFSADRDLQRMKACDHNIIANSSYSWWGAYLNDNPMKRVIFPRRWFGSAKASWDTKDLIPQGWEGF